MTWIWRHLWRSCDLAQPHCTRKHTFHWLAEHRYNISNLAMHQVGNCLVTGVSLYCSRLCKQNRHRQEMRAMQRVIADYMCPRWHILFFCFDTYCSSASGISNHYTAPTRYKHKNLHHQAGFKIVLAQEWPSTWMMLDGANCSWSNRAMPNMSNAHQQQKLVNKRATLVHLWRSEHWWGVLCEWSGGGGPCDRTTHW